MCSTCTPAARSRPAAPAAARFSELAPCDPPVTSRTGRSGRSPKWARALSLIASRFSPLISRWIGIPIRREISGVNRLAMSDKARAHFGLRPDLPVLLVTGGSQGASSLNRAAAGAAGLLRAAGVQVLHIVGPRAAADIEVPPGDTPYLVLPYVDRMDLAYAAADFALCRAGAMTCAELTAVGLPAAYVPLPHGNGEQRLNALPVERAGGGMIVDDAR